MNFPLRTAFAVSHRFWVVVSSFSFVSRKFLISSLISFLTHSLFNSMLFNLHEFECFGVFSLRFVSSFSPLLSEKMLDMISIFLILLRLVLCPMMSSIFENVPCSFKRCVFCLFGIDFQFQSPVVRENAWYDFNFLDFLRLMLSVQLCGLYFKMFHVQLKERVFCFVGMKHSLYIS